jgi:hypothetical protein
MKNKHIDPKVLRPALEPALAFSSSSTAGSPDPVGRPGLYAAAGGSGDKPGRTIRAERRRPSGPSEPGGRERAEAPHRERPSAEGGAEPPSEVGGTGGVQRPSTYSGGSLPRIPISGLSPRMLMIIVGIVVVLACCFIAFTLIQGPREPGTGIIEQLVPTSELSEPYVEPTAELSEPFVAPTPVPVSPTRTAKPTHAVSIPAVSSKGQKWLVMLYEDADDKILEQDVYIDLNEAERVGSSDRVQIVAQMDRFRGGFQGDGNWTDAKRFYVTQDSDLQRVRSQQVADLGEVNMSDGQTLVDFVTWAIGAYPADKYVLILSDHGMGWPGGWSDADSDGRGDPSLPLSSATGDDLFLMELDQALEESRAQAGLEQFELIGLDACVMGHLEVLSALAPHARYAVVSQETEPAVGWAYTAFLTALTQNPDMDGAELGRLIVSSYIEEDQRIVDDQARADFVGQGSPMGSLFGSYGGVTAEQLAQEMESSSTLTAVDLAAIPELLAGVNDLSFALTKVDQRAVAQARTYAQSFTSVFGSNVPPSYLDLANFVQLLKRGSSDASLTQACDRVLAAINAAVIAEKHGPQKPGARGISIYFPNSQLYRSPMAGPQSYTVAARRFAEESLWDDFLAFHYTGRSFKPATSQVVVPERGAAIQGPGASKVVVSPITFSANVAAPGQPVLLSADISGENIGYVYIFAGFYDKAANSIFVADKDYLESGDTRQIDGVYYPDWGEGAFTMEFEWEPLMFAVSDGTDSVTTLLTPRSFSASAEEAVYTVDGIYTYADGGESRNARLYFSNGVLRQVFGFTGEGEAGAPREIIPQAGDTFTILEQWLDLDQSGKVTQLTTQEGGTLTFGDQMFTWKELDAAPGQYIVGFIVEDLDGDSYQAFGTINVQ